MMRHLETVPFGEKKEHSVWCYVVFEIVTRTVGGMSKEIILFTTLLPVLTRYNVLRKFPLSLHAVSQWGGRESLPSQGFQLEIGNYKQVLDLSSIPQNLNPNYIKKQASKCSREKCSLQKLWANRLHMEILTRSWGKLRPEILKQDGPFTVTSSWYSCRSLNGIFWKAQILAPDNWMKMLDLFTYFKYTNMCIFLSHILAKKILKIQTDESSV